jgi:hypothetical protein
MESNITFREREMIMSWINEDTYSGFWDLGEYLGTDLLTSPIRRMIRRDAERHGIDLGNPRRSVASLLGSCGMGAAFGAVLGPPGGILGGLLGYVMAIGSDYEGDRDIESSRYMEEKAKYYLELKALQIAAEVFQDYLDDETWAGICDEIGYEIDTLALHYTPESLDDALSMMFEAVSDGIERVDVELCSFFVMVHDQVRYELGLYQARFTEPFSCEYSHR